MQLAGSSGAHKKKLNRTDLSRVMEKCSVCGVWMEGYLRGCGGGRRCPVARWSGSVQDKSPSAEEGGQLQSIQNWV